MEFHVHDARFVLEPDAALLQPPLNRQHYRVILIVSRPMDGGHRRDGGKQMNEMQEVTPHLCRAVPRLKREHNTI
jgi:hypothetical protein